MELWREKKKIRVFVVLLTMTIFVSGNGMTVLAETISENDVWKSKKEAEDSVSVSENNNEEFYTEENGDIIEGSMISVSDNQVGAVAAVPDGTPKNPVHNCTMQNDGTDTTTMSYVYFGSYPQEEVLDEEIITAIEEAIKAGNGKVADAGIDVWIGGIKYRRISKSDTVNDQWFGESEFRYFKWKRIKWRVLWNDGDSLFLMADNTLDCSTYNEVNAQVTWESCSLRAWINNVFFQTAFSKGEQNDIITKTITNEDNVHYKTEGGNNTTDKVYLLSIDELTNVNYGFCTSRSVKSKSRQLENNAYAYARGSRSDGREQNGYWWWLRSPGMCSNDAAVVSKNGTITLPGSSVYVDNGAIVPAINIKLHSTLWTEDDDGSSGAGGEIEVLSGLEATKVKTTYYKGDKLNLDDLVVYAKYYSGERKKLDVSEYVTNAESMNMNTLGTKNLTIYYQENNVLQSAIIPIKVTTETKAATKPKTPTSADDNTPVKVMTLTIKAPSKKLAAGKTVKLSLTVKPTNATDKSVKWKTSNKKYAMVDKNGKLTLKKAGAGKTVTVTATTKDGSGKKAKIKIKIMKHSVKSIKLKAPKKSLKAGKSMIVKATIKTTGKSVNRKIKWSSSNKKYATVNSKGKVTAKKAGKGKTVTITAKSMDGSNKKAKIKIKIK